MKELIRKVINDNREALESLLAYDRGEKYIDTSEIKKRYDAIKDSR